MPLYEYHCSVCERRFETLRRMSQADDPIHCPHCTSPNPRRVLSVFAAISKDGGSSRLVASSSAKTCGGCAGGSCATCGH